MTAVPFEPGWAAGDVDAVALWSESGAEWLTSPGVEVPQRLVAGVVGLVQHLDAAGAGLAHDSVAEGVGLLAERAAAVGLGPSSHISCGGATRLLAAADGWIAVSLARDDDIDVIPAWLDLDGVVAGDHWSAVAEAVVDRTCASLVARAALLGLACSTLGEQQVVDARLAAPVLIDRIVDRPPVPLSDLVVVNLASLWAGPLAAEVLARLGARVITVESEERPDGARATQRFFESLHTRTESVALSLTTTSGRRRLASLIEQADVVIEGSRPRALEQMGIDAESCVRNGVRLWVSITGHGRSGQAANRIAFGDDAAVAGGLVGWMNDVPRFLGDAIADPLAGLMAAATVVDLAGAGAGAGAGDGGAGAGAGAGGAMVDVALSRVAASFAPEPDDGVVAPSGSPQRPRVRAGEFGPCPLGRDTSRLLAEFGIR